MRRVVRSRTYVEQLKTFIEQGTKTFGATVAERTLARIDHTIEQHLARYPKKPINDQLAAIMHHASRFCSLGWRPHAVDPSVWIGVPQLALQRIGD